MGISTTEPSTGSTSATNHAQRGYKPRRDARSLKLDLATYEGPPYPPHNTLNLPDGHHASGDKENHSRLSSQLSSPIDVQTLDHTTSTRAPRLSASISQFPANPQVPGSELTRVQTGQKPSLDDHTSSTDSTPFDRSTYDSTPRTSYINPMLDDHTSSLDAANSTMPDSTLFESKLRRTRVATINNGSPRPLPQLNSIPGSPIASECEHSQARGSQKLLPDGHTSEPRTTSSEGSPRPSINTASSIKAHVHWDLTTSDTGVTDSVATNAHRERRGYHRCTPMMAPLNILPHHDPNFGIAPQGLTSADPLIVASYQLDGRSTASARHQKRSAPQQRSDPQVTSPISADVERTKARNKASEHQDETWIALDGPESHRGPTSVVKYATRQPCDDPQVIPRPDAIDTTSTKALENELAHQGKTWPTQGESGNESLAQQVVGDPFQGEHNDLRVAAPNMDAGVPSTRSARPTTPRTLTTSRRASRSTKATERHRRSGRNAANRDTDKVERTQAQDSKREHQDTTWTMHRNQVDLKATMANIMADFTKTVSASFAETSKITSASIAEANKASHASTMLTRDELCILGIRVKPTTTVQGTTMPQKASPKVVTPSGGETTSATEPSRGPRGQDTVKVLSTLRATTRGEQSHHSTLLESHAASGNEEEREDSLTGHKPVKQSTSILVSDTASMVLNVPTANTNYVQEGDYAMDTWTAAQKAAPSEPTSSKEGHHAFENSGELTIPQGMKISYFGQGCRQITLLHVKVRELAANVTCDVTPPDDKLRTRENRVLEAPKSLNKGKQHHVASDREDPNNLAPSGKTDGRSDIDHQGRQTRPVDYTTGRTSTEGHHAFDNTDTYVLRQPYDLNFPPLGHTPSNSCATMQDSTRALKTPNVTSLHDNFSNEGQKPSKSPSPRTQLAFDDTAKPTSLHTGHQDLPTDNMDATTALHEFINNLGPKPGRQCATSATPNSKHICQDVLSKGTTYAAVLLTPVPSTSLKRSGQDSCQSLQQASAVEVGPHRAQQCMATEAATPRNATTKAQHSTLALATTGEPPVQRNRAPPVHFAATTPTTTMARRLRSLVETHNVSTKTARTRSKKLQRHKSSMRVHTSDATSMRTELNKLQREFSQGLTSLEELSYRSTTMAGDFNVRHTPMHRDNPRKASRRARFGTITTSTMTAQAPSAETMSSDPTMPQNGTQQPLELTARGHRVKNPATTAGSDDSTKSDATSRPSTPSALNSRAEESTVTKIRDFKPSDTLRPRAPGQCTMHPDVRGSGTLTLATEEAHLASQPVQFDKNLFDKINVSYNDAPIQGPLFCKVHSLQQIEGHSSEHDTSKLEPLRGNMPQSVTTRVTRKHSQHQRIDMGPKPNPNRNPRDKHDTKSPNLRTRERPD